MEKAPEKFSATARSGHPTSRRRKRPPLPRHIQIRESRLPSTIGQGARLARARAGLTQAEVAEASGMATEVYGRLERGLHLPSVPTLMRVCLTLASGPNELMGFGPTGDRHHENDPRESMVPPDLNDTPDKRRLLRLLARLDRPRLKLVLRLVAFLLLSP